MEAQKLVFKLKSWWKLEWELVCNGEHLGNFSIVNRLTYREAVATSKNNEWKLTTSLDFLTNKITVLDNTDKIIAKTTQISIWPQSRYQIELNDKKYILSLLPWSLISYSVKDDTNQEILIIRLGLFGWSATINLRNHNNIDDINTILLIFILFYYTKTIRQRQRFI